MVRLANYGRTWTFRPSAIEAPENANQLRSIVARATKLRVMGSRHSWSEAIVTDATIVSLEKMNRIVCVDREKLLVTVEAGITLHDLIRELEARGLALSNLGSIDRQSLAGAISTGTHGTGIEFRCLASQAESLRFVDAAGVDRELGKGEPDFDAVVVGLGCFGVVYEITLSVVPCFQMHAITDTASFDEVIENLDELVHGFDHFKLWWLVPEDKVIVFKNRRTDLPRNDSDWTRWFKDELLAVIVYRSLLALQKLERRRLVPAVNKFLGREVGKRFERVCKSHVGFLTPAPPVHRETEWAFDYANAKSLLAEYRRTLLDSGHTYNFIQEIRFSKADDFWLSPAYGRDSIWLGMYNIDDSKRWDDQLRQFEAFARKHGGRPHWGKEASFDPDYLEANWPKMRDFEALQRTYDPNGKLVNDWVARILRRPGAREISRTNAR